MGLEVTTSPRRLRNNSGDSDATAETAPEIPADEAEAEATEAPDVEMPAAEEALPELVEDEEASTPQPAEPAASVEISDADIEPTTVAAETEVAPPLVVSRMRSTSSPVPTGTVDFVTTTIDFFAAAAISRVA